MPKKNANCERKPIAPASVAVIVMVSVSRCLMWASSWAITPASSSLSQVSQQAAGHRDRAVLGVAPGRERVGLVGLEQVDLGHRQPGAPRQLLDQADQARARSPRVTGRALCMRSTALSEFQYAQPFIASAIRKAISRPPSPASR